MKRKLKLIIFILLLLLVICAIFLPERLIRINNIECRSQYGYCNQDLVDQSKNLLGQRYFDVKKNLKNMLDEKRTVSSYQLFYKPPTTVKLNVVIRKGVILFRSGQSQKYFLVGEDGIVLSSVNVDTLGVIDIKSDLEIGSDIDDKLKFAVNIYQKLAILEKIESARFEDDGFYVKLSQGPTVIFPAEGDVDVLVGSYVVIGYQLNHDDQNSRIEKDKNMLTIDLRFKNPVIK